MSERKNNRLSKSNAKDLLALRDKEELARLDEALGGYVEQPPAAPEPVPERPAGRQIQKLLRPAVRRPTINHLREEQPMRLTNSYSRHLLALAIARFIEQTINPNGSYENRNANRDLFMVSALQKSDNDFVEAAKLLKATMEGAKVPNATVQSTIDALCYNVLKQSVFGVWIDYNRALRVEEGVMPDNFFEKLMERAPEAVNGEVDQTDVKAGTTDHREELAQDAPVGLDTDYVNIGGFEWQIAGEVQGDNGREGLAPLHNRVADGLEDLRVFLETVRFALGVKTDQRLPFFVEQVAGDWVRHDGNVYDALLAFTQKQNERNKQRAVSQDLFFQEQAKRLAASVA